MSKSTQIRKSVRRRKVAQLAAYSRKYTVNNTTIPIEVKNPIESDEKTTEWYSKLRKSRKEALGKKTGNKPWYMLQKKEIFKLTEKNIPKKMGFAERCERLVQLKLKDWEKKNPCPIKKDGIQKDLFEQQYLPEWEKAREEALEHIRDVVVSMYHKLKVVGNKVDYGKGQMKSEVVAEIKDEDMKGHHVKHPDLKPTDKLYKKATKAAQKAMKKDSAIVDADLLNHKETEVRPLIEAKRAA